MEMPVKKIKTKEHLTLFKRSPAFKTLVEFLKTISQAVQGKTLQDAPPPSTAVSNMLGLLEKIDGLVDATPPVAQTARFANPAVRVFHTKLAQNIEQYWREAVDEQFHELFPAIQPYILDSFGNQTRMDYGSGHELAFVAFLCCCSLKRIFAPEDTASLCLHIFNRYLILCRRLQHTYRLEPAGSQGVWGLDDHQFLCYYWGASQLMGQGEITPTQISDEMSSKMNSDDYMFFAAVRNIFEVKTGPFFEHSRVLYDISGVPEWSKVNSGLLKMYKKEVLDKFPVMQHFFFGDLLVLDIPDEGLDDAGNGRPPPIFVDPPAKSAEATVTPTTTPTTTTTPATTTTTTPEAIDSFPVQEAATSVSRPPPVVVPVSAKPAVPKGMVIDAATKLPVTVMPTQGGPVGVPSTPAATDDTMAAPPSTGSVRVAERGSLLKKRT
eukprot:m.42426 g.42426  ORF g.42426 m.42426 type:complete len:437 (-) comp10690_c0_seq1:450-1760(-)